MAETTPASVQSKLWSRPVIAISLAAAILIVGYADLLRGGLTLSAAMLTLGYLMFVPIAIMAAPAVNRPTYSARKKSR